MYNGFKMQSDDADPARNGLYDRPAAIPAIPAVQSEEKRGTALLDALATLSTTNGHTVLQHGARIQVIGDLLAALLTHLPNGMRADIAVSFRDRVEALMALGDDRCLPEKFHSAMLAEVNRYLNALE